MWWNYNSTNDTTLINDLANTNEITTTYEIYRYDFHAISTYSTFVDGRSITNIVSETFANLTENANINDTPNVNITGDLAVGGDTTLGGNVGICGDSGTETLLVTGSERVTSNLHVGGNLVIDGSFNFSEVIQNITTVNNEVAFSTQLDISNQGTALKVSQFGVGDDQHVALFNAGTEGDAFKIDSSGNSHFYKDVDVSGG